MTWRYFPKLTNSVSMCFYNRRPEMYYPQVPLRVPEGISFFVLRFIAD
jgi:hypothetical protein